MILELTPENQKILDAILVDEYFEKINKYLKSTFWRIVTDIKLNDEFELETLGLMCAQSRTTHSEYLSDLVKLIFLGYITRKDETNNSGNFILGSKKFFDIIEDSSWHEEYQKLRIQKANHLKLYLKSELNSIKGKNYLTRYRGETIENIFKKDPEYIIEKIGRGHFILGLPSVEILENKYKFKFSDNQKNYLKIANQEYSAKEEYEKLGSNIGINNPTGNNDKVRNNAFLKFLVENKLPYEITNDKIIVKSNFHWFSDSKLIDNLTITGNLKVYNLSKHKKLIPKNLSVDGYIQFETYEFIEGYKATDTWLKI